MIVFLIALNFILGIINLFTFMGTGSLFALGLSIMNFGLAWFMHSNLPKRKL